jgi:hypothetical protein
MRERSGCGLSSVIIPKCFIASPMAVTRAAWLDPSPVFSASARSRSSAQSCVMAVLAPRSRLPFSMASRIP